MLVSGEQPRCRELGMNPLRHYLVFGANEGRDPGPFFSTRRYVAANTDVTNAGMNPLAHYVLYGAAEGRACGTHTSGDAGAGDYKAGLALLGLRSKPAPPDLRQNESIE
jgi:hypothetical protein